MRALKIDSNVKAVIPMTPIRRCTGLLIAQMHEQVLGASLDPFQGPVVTRGKQQHVG